MESEEIEYIEPHTEKWIEAHIGRLSSSSIHKIFINGRSKDQLIGDGGLSYVDEKIGEILTQSIDEVRQTDKMMRGLAEEYDTAIEYEQITNQKVDEATCVIYNTILCGTHDGAVKDGNRNKIICEFKNPDSKKHVKVLKVKETKSDLIKIDPQYYHQPQCNMLFFGAECADFVSRDSRIIYPDLRLRIVRIYPDELWRKDFRERMDWIADYVNESLELAMRTPQINEQYRVTDRKSEISKLQHALDAVKKLT